MEAGFDLFLTTDKNIHYRQNLALRKISIVVLSRQQWPQLRPHIDRIVMAVNTAAPGSLLKWRFRPHDARPEGWMTTGGPFSTSEKIKPKTTTTAAPITLYHR